MLNEPSKYGKCFYGGLKKVIDWEASYVETRQRSARSNLSKTALNIIDGTSGAIKGVTAAIVLGYGAPLPITALVAISLLPSTTFKHLATKINEFNEWFFANDSGIETDQHSIVYQDSTLPRSNQTTITDYLPSLETLEITQRLIINALTLYQKLLPTNWLQIMVVEAIEQPLRWYNAGKLPDYYAKNAVIDWVWMVSGVGGEVLQSYRLLNNLNYSKSYQTLNDTCINDTNNIIKVPNIKPYLPINKQHVVTLPLIAAFSLLKGNNIFMLGIGLSMIRTIDAGSININLQAGIHVNVSIDLTQLAGTDNINNLIINYPLKISLSGLSLCPTMVGNYVSGQSINGYQLLAQNQNNVDIFSTGIQYNSIKTAFFVEGQLKWKYYSVGPIQSAPAIGADGTIYILSLPCDFSAFYPNGILKWQYHFVDNCYPSYNGYDYESSSAAIGNDGTIYVGTSSNFYAIFPNGTLNWKYKTWGDIESSPAIGLDGTIYIGTIYSRFYAIFPNGTLKQNFPMCLNIAYDIASSPAIGSDGTVYVGVGGGGCCNGGVAAYSPYGTCLWLYGTSSNGVRSSPAIGNDGTIYVGDFAGSLHAIFPNGTLKWKYLPSGYTPSGYPIESSPAIGNDGTIYVGGYDNNLYAISPTGTLKWKYLTGGRITSSPAIGNDGTIYIGSFDLNLYAIFSDGTLKWKYTSGAYIRSHPTIGNDGTIYFGAWYDWNLYAVGTKLFSNEHPWPKFGQNNFHTSLQPMPPQLQLFDLRYLQLNGIPTITGSLSIDLSLNQDQNYKLDLNIATPTATTSGTSSATPSQTSIGTLSGTLSITPTPSETTTDTATPTPSPTGTPAGTPAGTPTGTTTPISTHTGTLTGTPSDSTSATPTSISSPTSTATGIATTSSTTTPSATTDTPTDTPTPSPTSTDAGTATLSSTSTINNLPLHVAKTQTQTPSNTPTVSINNNIHVYTVNPQQRVSILLSSNELFPNGNGILMLSATLSSGGVLPSWLSIEFTPKLFSSYINVNSNSIEVIGNIAYIADDYGLKIIDLSNLYEPKLIGNYTTTSVISSLTIVGNTVYLAANMAGLQIISIDNPKNLTLVNNYPSVDASSVAVKNNTVLVAGITGLYIFNKRTNQLLGKYLTNNPIKSINVQNTTAFIGTNGSGLQIINISDVTRPALISSYTLTKFVNGITVTGNMVFIADLDLGLQIIDINNLNEPTLLGQYNALVAAKSVTVTGSIAFVIDNNGLQVIDISSAINPSLLGNYNPSVLSTKRHLHRSMEVENTNSTSDFLSYATIINTNTIAVGKSGLQIIDCTKWILSGTSPNNTNIISYDILLTAIDIFGKTFNYSLELQIEIPTPSPTKVPSPTRVPLSSETKSAESNNGLYIGAAVGGSIVGVAATSALILYCYKKRQKNRSIILPGTTLSIPTKETNAEVLNPEIPEATITSPDVTVNGQREDKQGDFPLPATSPAENQYRIEHSRDLVSGDYAKDLATGKTIGTMPPTEVSHYQQTLLFSATGSSSSQAEMPRTMQQQTDNSILQPQITSFKPRFIT